MTEDQVVDILQKKKAVLKGHFLLSSGRHSDTYIQCAKVFQFPKLTKRLAGELTRSYRGKSIDLVVSPAVGGIILGFAVAEALDVRMIFSEREKRKMRFRREFSILPGEKTLVVEDVVTTGGSVKEVIDLVDSRGGGVVGVASLIDRGDEKVFDVPLNVLVRIKAQSYPPGDCPLCRRDVPLSDQGSKRL